MSFLTSLTSKSKSAFSNVNSLTRWIFMKTIGVALAIAFLFLALVFLSYGLISVVTSTKGREAKIYSITNHMGRHQTACRVGGLFDIATQTGIGINAKRDTNIYCLYPAWPDQLQPSLGDSIRVWPSKKPLVGAPLTDGWGWFIVGSIFIIGLLMLEFSFLFLFIH